MICYFSENDVHYYLLSHLQTGKKPQTDCNQFLTNDRRFANWKGLDSGSSHPNYVKCLLKIFCMTISIIWPSFMIKWFTIHIEKCTLHCWQTLIMMSILQRKEQFKKKVMNRAFPWNKKIIRLWLHLFVFSGGNLENCLVDNI